MTPARELLVRRHVDGLGMAETGEASLLPCLMRWLIATGRIRARTHVAFEVPWLGRRVDLALLTGRGTTSAFELKLGRIQRVLEQASYNDLSFHRSWVVVGNRPKSDGLEWARHLGLGLIVVRPPSVTLLLRPILRTPQHSILRRVQTAITTRAIPLS
jgi:hypothetical protein